MSRCLATYVFRCVILLILVLGSVLGGFVGAIGAAEEDKIVLALERAQDNMDPHMHSQRVGILMNPSTIRPGSLSCVRG
jgi:hypothetical protein